MPRRMLRSWLSVGLVILILAVAPVALAMGTAFTYQGQLQKNNVPVTDTCSFEFRLFDALIDGSPVGSTLTKTGVTVANGLFTTTLDFGATAFLGSQRWLEVSAQCTGDTAFTSLSPLQELTPTPYSLNADKLDGYDAAAFWRTIGNAGTNPTTNFLGTTDNQALELRVNNTRILRLEPHATSPNLIAGYSGNSVTSGTYGATISGGGESGLTNRVTDYGGTVGGGANNQAGDNAGDTTDRYYATVGGGRGNTASGISSTVSGGDNNTANGNWATVSGGEQNTASGYEATISGGANNTASGYFPTVSGGQNNTASGQYNATVSGGASNTASHNYATVGGGDSNTASGQAATVSGGNTNNITDDYGTVGGGANNQAGDNAGTTADHEYATVGGGYANIASGAGATVSGGAGDMASGYIATVSGGESNLVTDDYGTVGGGHNNQAGDNAGTTADRPYATVSGGDSNTASGQAATVPGGRFNTASGDLSTSMGYGTTAESYAETVIGSYNADYTPASMTSWNANDHLFVIGKGTGSTARADALVMLKNGNTALNGQFVATLTAVDYAPAIYGTHAVTDSYGIGVQGIGGAIGVVGSVQPTGSQIYRGVRGIASGGSGTNYGVESHASGDGTNYGVYGRASGSGTNYGVYGRASGGSTNWAGYFQGDLAYTGILSDVSDLRLKENINPLNDAVDKVTSLRGIYFNNKGSDQREVGVIAQEVEVVLPEAVKEDGEGYKYVSYPMLTPVLIEAVKELKAENDTLRAELAAQQAMLDLLQQRLAALEQAAQTPVAALQPKK